MSIWTGAKLPVALRAYLSHARGTCELLTVVVECAAKLDTRIERYAASTLACPELKI